MVAPPKPYRIEAHVRATFQRARSPHSPRQTVGQTWKLPDVRKNINVQNVHVPTLGVVRLKAELAGLEKKQDWEPRHPRRMPSRHGRARSSVFSENGRPLWR